MFDDVASLDDTAIVAGIEDATRAAAAADARRLSLIAELTARRLGDEDDERHMWACDCWDAAAAEVAAAMGIAHRSASGEMRKALALETRLPTVADLHTHGTLNSRLISAITWRTQLVEDPDALAAIDAGLAERATGWGPLSNKKLEGAIDDLIAKHDPGAVRRTRQAARDRDICFGTDDDVTGTTAIFGRMSTTDAVATRKRLAAMAAGVCPDDPRTMGQRRSDAMGVLSAGGEVLACLCGNPDCAATKVADARAANTIVYILADPDALTAHPDPYLNGDHHTNPIPWNTPEPPAHADTPDPEESQAPAAPADTDTPAPTGVADAPAADADADADADANVGSADIAACPPAPDASAAAKPTPARQPWSPGTAVVVDGAVIPTPLLAQLIAAGATVRPLHTPGAEPEPRYRPSAKLAAWVRMRDMTCMFPGCDRAAERCDVDHTEPYPAGCTHASNTKALCRIHHLLKTFWAGWTDRQYPDGTIEWTTPSGRSYTKKPGARLFFPGWDTTTATLPPAPPRTPNDGTTMPRRTRSRTAQRTRQIRAERAANLTETDKPPPDL